MKKFISVIISIIILFTVAVPSFAYSDQACSHTVSFETNTTDSRVKPCEPLQVDGSTPQVEIPEGPSRPGYFLKEWNTTADGTGVSIYPGDEMTFLCDATFYAIWERDESNPVVTMYLCATANSLTGHLWLYFVNLTESELPLGYATLLPGEGMSVGSLKNSRTDGGGTYYNGEVMMAKTHLNKVAKHTVSLKMDLTMEQLEKVNEKIKSLNFYNKVFWNCSCFATQVWNSVSSKKVIHITLPFIAILNMYILGGKKGQITMQEASIERAYKQKDNGIVQASEKSFKTSCIG